MAKTKLSVTVSESIVREIDRVARDKTRSQVVEAALASWLRERRRQQLEDDIARYYSEMTDAERNEDSEWAALSRDSGGKMWP